MKLFECNNGCRTCDCPGQLGPPSLQETIQTGQVYLIRMEWKRRAEPPSRLLAQSVQTKWTHLRCSLLARSDCMESYTNRARTRRVLRFRKMAMPQSKWLSSNLLESFAEHLRRERVFGLQTQRLVVIIDRLVKTPRASLEMVRET
jgi:hypothetical protein